MFFELEKKEVECCSLLYLKGSCLCVCGFVIAELLSSLAIVDMVSELGVL